MISSNKEYSESSPSSNHKTQEKQAERDVDHIKARKRADYYDGLNWHESTRSLEYISHYLSSFKTRDGMQHFREKRRAA